MSKIKKYGKLGKKMLAGASSGIIAGMFLMGVSTPSSTSAAEFSETSVSSYSQNSPAGMHTMRRWNSKSKINALINSLGLDPAFVQAELKSGKTLKQILQESGVETAGLYKASDFSGKNKYRTWNK